MNNGAIKAGAKHTRSGRRLIVSPYLTSYFAGGSPLPGSPTGAKLLILPNRQAARSLAVPYRSLDGLALRIIQDHGLQVAPKLISHRLLQRAVAHAGGSVDSAGMARAVESTLRELLRAGVELPTLALSSNGRVSRLAAIALAYRSSLREQGLIDTAELLWQAAELAPRPVELLVAGFPRLPAAERAFLDAIAAPESRVYLPIQHGEGTLFEENRHATEDFRLRGWLVEESKEVPEGLGVRLARHFLTRHFHPKAAVKPAAYAYAYPDMDAEARGTLAAIKRLLLKGVSPDRMAIVARAEESYGPLLLRVAREYQVSLRVLYQMPLAQTRFGAWLGKFIETVRSGFPFESTARLLAHPLVRALDGETWRKAREAHSSGAEAWGELLPLIGEAWPQEASREQFTTRLRLALERLGVARNVMLWPREASAYQAFLDELRALPGGSREITLTLFVAEVSELTRVLTVAAQPGRGGVELHTPLSLFGAQVDHLFVVGAAEGVLPSPVRPDPLLDPFEREDLQSDGHPVESVSSAALREELSFWALLHSAGTSFTISYPRLLGRSEVLPSPFIARLGLVPQTPPSRPLCSLPELRRSLLRANPRPEQRNSGEQDDLPHDEVLLQARHAHRVEASRESEAPFDRYDGLVGSPYRPPSAGLGVTRLIALAGCPFKFFGGSVLRLSKEEEAAEVLEASLQGRLYHQVLHLVMERSRGSEDPRAAALEALDAAFEVAEQEFDLPALPSWHLERDQHLVTLQRAISAQDFIAPLAQVRELESNFKAEWRGIPVRGQVDRIDLGDEGLELVDYKSGSQVSNLAKDVDGRSKVDLQLSIYREAAAAVLAPAEPVARSRYYSVKGAKDLRVTEPTEEELDRIAGLAKAAWRDGSYPVDPDLDAKVCEFCEFDLLCRKGPRLERKRNRQ
ncbi:MAG: PD-(D/E)XK nuclease family protein [Trueperaceae bacterium]